MVDALAKSWRCLRHAGGKTVQAVIVVGFLVRCAMSTLGAGSGLASAMGASERLLGGAMPLLVSRMPCS
jgi:hypothetical protein